ncbi:MAG: site-2 protease family protein [Oculatellaceae cyanobacterium Prado106]|jgi:Zn-dependent protease|nr:site-2 protease family protein [Oculatellaceae cyanobacterium Prado106]
MMTAFILLITIGILIWGYYRSRPYGRPGIMSWLQSITLMLPWLLFFGLSAAGVFLNLASVLFLFVGSTLAYILIGRQLRSAANTEELLKRSMANAQVNGASPTTPVSPTTSDPDSTSVPATSEAKSEVKSEVKNTDFSIPAMPAEDVQAVKGIFGIDTFFATETIPYQDGVIFRGNLRGDSQYSHDQLSANLKAIATPDGGSLGDRYRLFLIEGPEAKPVVVVLPSSNDPKPTTLVQGGLAGVLAIATLATSLETAGVLRGFDFFAEPQRFAEVWPISLGIVVVLAIHELGHWAMARRHQVKLSPPFFIPTWQIGSFGALTRFQSLLPNRSVLFDVAFAGPALGGLVALGMLSAGLLLSHSGSLFQIPAEFFQGSILVGTLARLFLGSALQQPLVDIHPLVIVGWLGLVITAINLMPAGQLDGGRIVQAIYGRKTAGRLTVVTLIVLFLATLANPLALYWAIVILFLQRDLERPALNELVEPDDTRAALGLLALFLMAATLLPLTPALAGRLGIGG